MKRMKVKRRFKYRILLYAFIMFIGYELSFNIIMNLKLVNNNEDFIKILLVDSNYHMLYEKKASNLFTKLFNKVLNVNEPISILENIMHYNPNKNVLMTYVTNPNIDEVNNLNVEPTVYIYNTHQTEAYQGDALEGYNIKPGVMMASYLLQERLAKQNIKANVMEDNISDYLNLNNMNYSKSYIASRKFLASELEKQNYKLIIDLHRDALSHDKSTTTINNKACAQILFVIGEDYDSYENNLKNTNKLNDMIKIKYPNLTKGVIIKGGKGVNGIYNQDLNSNITLIEIGGNENNITEILNTIELISPIIGEYVNET